MIAAPAMDVIRIAPSDVADAIRGRKRRGDEQRARARSRRRRRTAPEMRRAPIATSGKAGRRCPAEDIAPTLRAWIRSPGSRGARRARRSCSTSTACSRRSSPGRRMRACPTRRGRARRLLLRYGLVACVTGRSSEQAPPGRRRRRLVIAGEHGLELEPARRAWVEPDPRARCSRGLALDGGEAAQRGVPLRRAPDPEAAREQLEEVAPCRVRVGLRTRWGRMVLEVLPPDRGDEGHGCRASARRKRPAAGALYAGDDTTTSTASPRSTGSSWRYGWPSCRPRGPASSPGGGRRRRVACGISRAAPAPLGPDG